MVKLGELKNLRHESNLVELKPWQSMHKSITLPMITALGGKDIPGSQLVIGFAYIDQPEEKIGIKAHIHPDRDQWIFLFGARNFVEFDADVEFTWMINGTRSIIPSTPISQGMITNHCASRAVSKPLIFIDARVAPDSAPPIFVEEKPGKQAGGYWYLVAYIPMQVNGYPRDAETQVDITAYIEQPEKISGCSNCKF